MKPFFGPLARKLAGAGLPAIAGAMGGPLAGAVVATVAQRLGMPDAAPEALERALEADPSLALKLKQLDVDLAEQANRTMEIEASDRANARSSRRDDRMRIILACILVPAPMVVLVLMATGKLSLTTTDTVTVSTILGFMLSEARAATAYFFGTSVGSSRRAQELASIAERKP